MYIICAYIIHTYIYRHTVIVIIVNDWMFRVHHKQYLFNLSMQLNFYQLREDNDRMDVQLPLCHDKITNFTEKLLHCATVYNCNSVYSVAEIIMSGIKEVILHTYRWC